jgi:cytidylate kinase
MLFASLKTFVKCILKDNIIYNLKTRQEFMIDAIIISGPPGSGSSSTTRVLAPHLGRPYLIVGDVFKGIENVKIYEAIGDKPYYPLFQHLCKKYGVILPERVEGNSAIATVNLWKTKIGSDKKLHYALDELQIELARGGNIVIDGKLAIHMMRARRICGREKADAQKLGQALLERETIERRTWGKIYGFDYFDQHKQADIVIDTTSLSVEGTVNQILDRINQ